MPLCTCLIKIVVSQPLKITIILINQTNIIINILLIYATLIIVHLSMVARIRIYQSRLESYHLLLKFS